MASVKTRIQELEDQLKYEKENAAGWRMIALREEQKIDSLNSDLDEARLRKALRDCGAFLVGLVLGVLIVFFATL